MSIAETLKKEWYVLLILLVPFIASAVLWNQLPDTVPTHFNIQGEADDWGPKWMTAIMLPAIGIGVYFLLLITPLIDPKKKIENTQKPIAAIRIFTAVFFVAIYGFVMAITMGVEFDLSAYVHVGVGILFIIIGNYLNSVKPNYFIGIRTPWTLEFPLVWKKTHRFSSKVWILGGLVFILVPTIPVLNSPGFLLPFILIVLAGLPVVYSYLVYRKYEKEEE